MDSIENIHPLRRSPRKHKSISKTKFSEQLRSLKNQSTDQEEEDRLFELDLKRLQESGGTAPPIYAYDNASQNLTGWKSRGKSDDPRVQEMIARQDMLTRRERLQCMDPTQFLPVRSLA
jgi:hypothetical protein